MLLEIRGVQSNFPDAFPSSAYIRGECFSLISHPLSSSGRRSTTRERSLKASVIHPIVLVGIQSEAPPDPSTKAHTASTEATSPSARPRMLALAEVLQPSLSIHITNQLLAFEQGRIGALSPLQGFPAWFMLFGLLCGTEGITIVAHIPFIDPPSSQAYTQHISPTLPRIRCLSMVVDHLPLVGINGSVAPESDPPVLSNIRASLAIFALKRHAFRMASLSEGVVWPSTIRFWELMLELHRLGPTPTPSEATDFNGGFSVVVNLDEMIGEDWDEEELSSESSEGRPLLSPARSAFISWWTQAVHSASQQSS